MRQTAPVAAFQIAEASPRRPARRLWRHFIGRVFRVRMASGAITIVLGVVLMALLAPLIAPEDPNAAELGRVLQPPSNANLMGTDELGRDLLSRIIYGARASVSAGLVSTAIALFVGTLLGVIAGYFLGAADTIIMRVIDAMLAFPGIVLALAITAALGPGLTNAMIAIGIVNIPRFARLARAQVLLISRVDYVEAARTLGASHARILRAHVGPNMLTPIIIQTSLSIALAMLTEASLSFLGLGIQPPTPSWGFMLNTGRSYLELAPWLAIFPGMAIFVVVLAINVVGDAVRDALDPRLRIS